MKQQNMDKLTDKAFMRLIITSVLAIVVCLVCLCSTTWAWFSDSRSSSTNSITSAQCLLKITITSESGTNIEKEFENGEFSEILSIDQYTMTLEIPDESASGYCIIKVGDKELYTQAVSNNPGIERRKISFTLEVTEQVTVTVIPRWGIYSGDIHVENNGALPLPPTSVLTETDTETETETETETDTDTETETEETTENQ